MNTLLVSLLAGLAMDLSRIVPVIVGVLKGAVSSANLVLLGCRYIIGLFVLRTDYQVSGTRYYLFIVVILYCSIS